MAIEIRRSSYRERKRDNEPFWTAPDDQKIRPVIRCKCGMFCDLAGYAINRRGIVTPEFFHSVCKWRANLILKEYDRGEF